MVFDSKLCCKIGLGFCFVFLGMISKDSFMGCKLLFFASRCSPSKTIKVYCLTSCKSGVMRYDRHFCLLQFV